MGFLQAVHGIGIQDKNKDLSAYLSPPLEKGGKVIRVFLEIADPMAEVLDVKGVVKVDVADYKTDETMKMKYLYRKSPPSANWRYSPLHRMGKPARSREQNRKALLGENGDWQGNKDTHFFKLRNRVIMDFEEKGFITPGSVDIIMKKLELAIDKFLDDLDPRQSHILIFGADDGGQFVYPGDIPAFIQYFSERLEDSLKGTSSGNEVVKNCVLCHEETGDTSTLTNVFKFATPDKVSFLPGLEEKEKDYVFPICKDCLNKVSAGRNRIERGLSSGGVIPVVKMWGIPETVGTGDSMDFGKLVRNIEQRDLNDKLSSLGEDTEERFLSRLAKEGHGLVFHFVFIEQNNAQELVHLMVEDVPPERLAFLEANWKDAMTVVFGEVKKATNLDWAIRSLYATLSRFAGKSKGDKEVFRDFALKIVGKMLRGEKLPILTFKQVIAQRAQRLVYETEKWDEVRKNILYAQAWSEFMHRINEGVGIS
ncbi:MAG: hypothetical protein GXX09_02510 [Syntrophomonadaceae bacterium]|nr:hypothetical protein [Syntrophomonadaceae bacterium]